MVYTLIHKSCGESKICRLRCSGGFSLNGRRPPLQEAGAPPRGSTPGNQCLPQPTGASPSTTQRTISASTRNMSDSQSGSSKPQPPRGESVPVLVDGQPPVVRHRCWRFQETVVGDLVNADGKHVVKWRHLFACVECKKLQSLQFFC